MENKSYYVYILASKKDGVLYIGVTNDLIKRTYQHQQEQHDCFTAKYHVCRLVYYEEYSNIEEAILREKQMKKWNRVWKIKKIEKENPEWNDLYEQII